LVTFALLGSGCWVSFGGWIQFHGRVVPLAFIPGVPLVWIALRFGPSATAIAVLFTATLAAWHTAHGFGPFVLATTNGSMLLLLCYLWVVAIIAFTLESDVSARRVAETSLERLNAELEQRVGRRTADLQESEELFRLLVQDVQDYAIFALDATGHIASWNAGAEKIKGYRAEDILGKHFSCFYPREAIEEGKPWRELEIATEVSRYEEEGIRVRKNGSQFWARVSNHRGSRQRRQAARVFQSDSRFATIGIRILRQPVRRTQARSSLVRLPLRMKSQQPIFRPPRIGGRQ
jgi:PAS domain S-box-containing protein